MKWFPLKPQTEGGLGSETPATATVQEEKKPVVNLGTTLDTEATFPEPA